MLEALLFIITCMAYHSFKQCPWIKASLWTKHLQKCFTYSVSFYLPISQGDKLLLASWY